MIGVLLAMATERVLRWPAAPDWRYAVRIVWFSALTFALVPIVPTELQVRQREQTPAFFAAGSWRDYVGPGGSVVVVPLPDAGDADPLHWQVEAGLEFPLAEGYFVGPATDGRGTYGAVRRPTSVLLEDVAEDGVAARVNQEQRVDLLRDLRYWKADVMVLPVRAPNQQPLRDTVERLLGRAPHVVRDVWVWDTSDLTRPHA